jgi:hypothetical protein
MGSIHRQVPQQAGISFLVVQNGGTYTPLLVRRESFISKVGQAAARKTYQIAYAPKDFPRATFVGPGDPL